MIRHLNYIEKLKRQINEYQISMMEMNEWVFEYTNSVYIEWMNVYSNG